MMSSNEADTTRSRIPSLLVGAIYLVAPLLLGVVAGRHHAPVSSFAEFSVPELDAVVGQNAFRGSVTLVMQPADCVSNTRSLEWWGALAGEGTVFVSAIIVTDDPAEAEAALRNARLTFPASTVGHGRIARSVRGMGYHATPLVILSDDTGRVRAAAPMGDFQSEEDVVAFLRSLLRSPSPTNSGETRAPS
jgi:hypothetical protein